MLAKPLTYNFKVFSGVTNFSWASEINYCAEVPPCVGPPYNMTWHLLYEKFISNIMVIDKWEKNIINVI